MFCGQLLCIHANCCKNKEGVGEYLQHAMICSGGKGIILLVKESSIFLLRKQIVRYASGAFVSSIYVDKYGEEDAGFIRGKPLFLSIERFEKS